MKEKRMRRELGHTGLIYGIIVSIINFLGFLSISAQTMPVYQSEAYVFWIDFINTHVALINVVSSLAFVFPVVFCVCYVACCKEENACGRLINLPVVYSLLGSLGWVMSLLMEMSVLTYVSIKYDINLQSVAISSILNIVQCGIFVGTLVFMCLCIIHRVYILPKYFPNGKLEQYKGSRKLSTTLILAVFYFSVGIFPVFYLISVVRNYSLIHEFEIENSVYFMVLGIIILSVTLLFTISFYINKPLRKLRGATEAIKDGQFGKLIDVVSNDDFGELADNFNDMSESLSEKSKRIVSIQNSIIRGMAMMVESRDNSTGGHINRTSECVRVFVGKMKQSGDFEISDSFEEAIIKAAPMHDLGKIAVDDAVLRKPGRFTPEEYEIMKKHSAEGARIVAEVLRESDDEEFKQIAVNVAHYHHEKWDGSGYPTKIKGEDIPYEARIMALADVFDALVSKRCYKDSMDFDKAFSIIEESLGQHFDPKLGAFFISCREELEELYKGLPE